MQCQRLTLGNRLQALLLIVLLVAAAACSEPPALAPTDRGSTSGAPRAALDPADTVADRLQSFAWDCEQSGYAVQNFSDGPETMWLFLPDTTVQLERAESASGARYTGTAIDFWSKGREARLTRDGQSENCSENRRASVSEDAKLRGMDFLATGNEPAWSLEIGPDNILLVTDYGARRELFARTAIETNEAARRTRFTAQLDNKTLKVELNGKACTDSMSGEAFETSVAVITNDQTLRGCGRTLH
jgi:uncharacterized membrane protein